MKNSFLYGVDFIGFTLAVSYLLQGIAEGAVDFSAILCTLLWFNLLYRDIVE